MTTSSYTKMLKQVKVKPVKLAKFMKHNVPKERTFGKESKRCRRCWNHRAHIAKYGLELCRRCFREVATQIGWKKYS